MKVVVALHRAHNVHFNRERGDLAQRVSLQAQEGQEDTTRSKTDTSCSFSEASATAQRRETTASTVKELEFDPLTIGVFTPHYDRSSSMEAAFRTLHRLFHRSFLCLVTTLGDPSKDV